MKPYQRVSEIGSLTVDGGMGLICSPETLESLLQRAAAGQLDPKTFLDSLFEPFDISEAVSQRNERVRVRMIAGESGELAHANEPQPPFLPGSQIEGLIVFLTGGDGVFPVRATTFESPSPFGPAHKVEILLSETAD